MTLEQIEARIAELKKELEQLVASANIQIGMKQGAIKELERIAADMREVNKNESA